jgi:hypothetical protein
MILQQELQKNNNKRKRKKLWSSGDLLLLGKRGELFFICEKLFKGATFRRLIRF